VDGLDVANNAFFIRSHGPSAQLDDLSRYSPEVAGHVDNPLTLTLDDLKAMPQRTFQASLECSGNSRGFFSLAAGYAWSGLGGIAKVEVSTDNGNTWNEATITENGGELSWVRFEYSWDAVLGPTGLVTLATDERGTSQPGQVPWNQLGYQFNAIQRVLVNVKT
jgi:hypothetical protein